MGIRVVYGTPPALVGRMAYDIGALRRQEIERARQDQRGFDAQEAYARRAQAKQAEGMAAAKRQAAERQAQLEARQFDARQGLEREKMRIGLAREAMRGETKLAERRMQEAGWTGRFEAGQNAQARLAQKQSFDLWARDVLGKIKDPAVQGRAAALMGQMLAVDQDDTLLPAEREQVRNETRQKLLNLLESVPKVPPEKEPDHTWVDERTQALMGWDANMRPHILEHWKDRPEGIEAARQHDAKMKQMEINAKARAEQRIEKEADRKATRERRAAILKEKTSLIRDLTKVNRTYDYAIALRDSAVGVKGQEKAYLTAAAEVGRLDTEIAELTDDVLTLQEEDDKLSGKTPQSDTDDLRRTALGQPDIQPMSTEMAEPSPATEEVPKTFAQKAADIWKMAWQEIGPAK